MMKTKWTRLLSASGTPWLLIGSLLALPGCGKDEEKSDAEVEETGVDIEKNPFGALKQLADVGKEMAEKAEKMEKHEPVTPVKFDALVPLLPEPKDWEKTGDPKAETTQMGQFQISTASQNYTKGEGQERQSMKVTVVDGSYVPMVYAPFLMMSKFSREGTDGHSKGLKIDGHPSFEEWKKKSGRVTLSILVKDRFLITIEGRNVKETLARDWAKYLDLKLLSKWAEDEVQGDEVSPPESEEETEDGEDEEAEKEEATEEDTSKEEEAEPEPEPAPAKEEEKAAPSPSPAPAPAAEPAPQPAPAPAKEKKKKKKKKKK